ncbi:MAG: hypothetical protein ABI970_20370 [Chloroflexota bacterium]|nr:hypothetical protein [Anaerolineae bacterium]
MSTHTKNLTTGLRSPLAVGSSLVTLAGFGLIGYGIIFLIRNFLGLIELGLSSENVGATPEQIQAFSPDLYHYISHVQVAAAGFIIGLGIAVVALAWFGIRSKYQWAIWTAFLASVVAVGIALPLHYPWGFATIGHLGLVYLDALLLMLGTVISYRALHTRS